MEHTPTPYEADGRFVVWTKERLSIAECYRGELPAEANAAYVVKCCNSHKELAEALRNLLDIVQWMQDSGNIKSPIEPHPYGLGVMQAKSDARAILAKLEKEA